MIGIYLLLYSEVLDLSTRPRATNGGVNITYLPLNKSLSITTFERVSEEILQIEEEESRAFFP